MPLSQLRQITSILNGNSPMHRSTIPCLTPRNRIGVRHLPKEVQNRFCHFLTHKSEKVYLQFKTLSLILPPFLHRKALIFCASFHPCLRHIYSSKSPPTRKILPPDYCTTYVNCLLRYLEMIPKKSPGGNSFLQKLPRKYKKGLPLEGPPKLCSSTWK